MPRLLVSMDPIAKWPWDRDHVSRIDPFTRHARATLPSPAARGAQRLQALRRANEVRIARAAMKHLIAAGKSSVVDALVSDSPEIAGMAVIELLLSQRSWGYARCRGLLRAVPMSEFKTVGSLTERQRSLLAALLGDETPVRPRRS